ncbi:MAG: polyamine aminopropyltransferase [Firmicutes bacterium]|jgi:spermidine synthase|nr:polyamine aminopropyltransferase [Bacillota bacterium]
MLGRSKTGWRCAGLELWYYETENSDLALQYHINQVLVLKQTDYQELAVVETDRFGRTLILDGAVQTTIKDEYVYHEMIAHVPLFTHPHPEKVLIIGGGDGGTVRETLKHKNVKEIHLVEIDPEVVAAAKEYLPEISCGLSDPRVFIHHTDGIKFVADHKNEYDLIIIDSSDPIGPAVGLFRAEFYANVYRALKDDGILVAQTESPWINADIIPDIYQGIKASFPITRMYLCYIPTYPCGMWSFTLGSKKYDPLKVDPAKITDLGYRYYTPHLHQASFALPQFVQEMIGEAAKK